MKRVFLPIAAAAILAMSATAFAEDLPASTTVETTAATEETTEATEETAATTEETTEATEETAATTEETTEATEETAATTEETTAAEETAATTEETTATEEVPAEDTAAEETVPAEETAEAPALTPAADGSIQVSIDGVLVTMTQSPVIESDYTLVPMRTVLEALGCTVEWNAETNTATATAGENVIAITVDQDTMTVNGETVALQVAARNIEGSVMIPVRAIAEAMGATVTWDEPSRTVVIVTATEETTEPTTPGEETTEPETPAEETETTEPTAPVVAEEDRVEKTEPNTSKEFHGDNEDIYFAIREYVYPTLGIAVNAQNVDVALGDYVNIDSVSFTRVNVYVDGEVVGRYAVASDLTIYQLDATTGEYVPFEATVPAAPAEEAAAVEEAATTETETTTEEAAATEETADNAAVAQ